MILETLICEEGKEYCHLVRFTLSEEMYSLCYEHTEAHVWVHRDCHWHVAGGNPGPVACCLI